MLILGLSPSLKNDAAGAVVRDGVIEAAIENYKLDPTTACGIPEAAIEYCLSRSGASWSGMDVVAIANDPFRGWGRRAISRRGFSPLAPMATCYQQGKELRRLAREWTDLRVLRHQLRGSHKVVTIDHHSCHAASAFFLSPFDKALILTLDGEGDGRGGLIATGDENRIRVQGSISFSDSIGWLYSRVTELLGFVSSKEEHKTQWIGLEGEPAHKEVFLRILRRPGGVLPRLDLHSFHRDIAGEFIPSRTLLDQLGLPAEKSEITGEQKRKVASSVQAAVTEVVSDLLVNYTKETGLKQICLGGGVFQNALLVASLESKFGVGNIFVPPAPGNAGSALGAAAWVWHQQMGKPRQPETRSVFWGPSYARQEIKEVLDNVKARYSLHDTTDKMLDAAVQLLEAGKIVGWFQGAAEFGPRSLGHRSILASPWAPYVAENLNDFVKHRESFRPFAVSVREEDCERFFESSPLCRFMNSLARVRVEAGVLPGALLLPGGMVRLHIVEKESNRVFWELLGRFGKHAPAPILVNTSFNLPGEPPVVRPRDAVRAFFCSGTEAVFVDNFLLTKWSSAYVLNGRAVQQREAQGTVNA
jgi:carbamoyltransferase